MVIQSDVIPSALQCFRVFPNRQPLVSLTRRRKSVKLSCCMKRKPFQEMVSVRRRWVCEDMILAKEVLSGKILYGRKM